MIKVGKFPFPGNGKAIALGDDGPIKTIFDEKRKFTGVYDRPRGYRTDPSSATDIGDD